MTTYRSVGLRRPMLDFAGFKQQTLYDYLHIVATYEFRWKIRIR
jgi:hypothetical protein